MSGRLLVISRDCLQKLEAADQERAARSLARLYRNGTHLLLTAAQPEQWSPTRGNVDQALSAQTELQQRVQGSGGELDGVYYVPRSLFSQDRNRRGALANILKRYGLKPDQVALLSNSRRFAATAEKMGISASWTDNNEQVLQQLAALSERGPET